jgi:hypothetical protein
MTKRDWLATGLRVAGVTMIVTTALQVGWIPLQFAFSLSLREGMPWLVLGTAALALVFVIAVWMAVVRWADKIALRIVPEEPPTGSCEGPEGQKAILVLSMRVMGAVALIGLVGTIIQTIGSWQNLTPGIAERTGTTVVGWVVSSVVTWSLLIGMTVYLLFGSKWLLWLAFPPEKPPDQTTWGGEQIPVFGSSRNLFSLALRVIGLCFLLKHVVRLVYALVIQGFPPIAESLRRPFNWERFIESLLVLVVGVYFLTGGKRLVNLLFRERTGTGDPSDETAGGEAGS